MKVSMRLLIFGFVSLSALAVPAQSGPQPPAAWSDLTPAERAREMARLAGTGEYACPMHPEVRKAEAGVCSKCGMPMVPNDPEIEGEFGLDLTTEPAAPEVGEPVTLRFVIRHPETGGAVTDLLTVHERVFHLFVISDDLSAYHHIHPEIRDDGSFEVTEVLHRPGGYGVHADFFPVGGTPQVIRRDLSMSGDREPGSAEPPELVADEELVTTLGDLRVELRPAGGELVAGRMTELVYHLTDAGTGEPVTDLEPYLGAWGHTLILDREQVEYLHSHPTENLPPGHDGSLRGGPEVGFRVYFPGDGLYRIWTQFQRDGEVKTASFTVLVRPEKG